MPYQRSERARGPKTELDEKFLSTARQVMKAHGITSDRAISLALGRKADFINRVSNGAQSATPEAWDALLNKYPEARNITNTIVTAHSGGQAIGINHGTANQLRDSGEQMPVGKEGSWSEWLAAATNAASDSWTTLFSTIPIEAYSDSLAAVLQALIRENELLRNQLTDKERTIQILLKQQPSQTQ